MLKIGDFSKLAQVSVKALRHYGELGLLKPAWVDRFTGYRHYTPDQLPRLNRILALKELGFSLEQIRHLLRSDLTPAELRGMMRVRHAELERQVQLQQARLARVEARLRQIEQEGAMPQYEVVLKQVRPQWVIGIRDLIPGYHQLVRLFEELRIYLETENVGLDTTNPFIAINYDAEHQDHGMDAEAAAPVARRLAGDDRMISHNLPGVETMACVVHSGGYDQLADAHSAVMNWIEATDHCIIGPNRDIVLQSPDLDRNVEDYIIEVQFPVEKKPISFYVTQVKEKHEMEPKIVSKPAFTVVGLLYHGKNENNEISQLWQEFNIRSHEVQDLAEPCVAYGVCGDLDDTDAFNYLAGLGVTEDKDIPDGMTSWQVPMQTYAVFPCTLKTIHEAYQYAFQTWLPGSGYQRADGPDFEYYDEEFDLSPDDPKLSIYIPIK